MNLLGHRNIESTLVYAQLISFESDEYYSAVATTVDQAKKLLEEGFEYVCQKDDIMLFRKRKQDVNCQSHIVNSHLHHRVETSPAQLLFFLPIQPTPMVC
jgi:hypothetical protein